MKFFLLILLTASMFLGSLDARPADDVVEIEKQRLIKFPADDFRYDGENNKPNAANSDSEAERIMQEIEKINLALGYVRKVKPVRRRYPPMILDSSQYLYPQSSSFFPFRSLIRNGVHSQPSIRSLLRFPTTTTAAAHYAIPVEVYDDNSLRMRSPNDGYKIVGDLEDFKKNQLSIPTKSDLKLDPRLRLFFVPQQRLLPPFREYIDPISQELKLRTEKVATHRTSTPETVVPTSPASSAKFFSSTPPDIEVRKRAKPQKEQRQQPNPAAATPATAQRHVIGDPTPTPQLHPLQNVFSSIFNRQKQQDSPTTTTINQKQQQQQDSPSPIAPINNDGDDNDYNWDDSSSTSDDDNEDHLQEKNMFGFMDQMGKDKTHSKLGGVIIKRLRVRKGGIAIAGPGGVATAGSGGTAIVGPGGYALTHPRSLTIAGPGAKVIAIPETTDLKEALDRTNNIDGGGDGAKSFPREGKLVATGPTIYYSPDILRLEVSRNE